MLWHLAEWAGTVLAVGAVAGPVGAAAVAVGAWLIYRRARRGVAAFASNATRYALQTTTVTAVRRRRLPPQVVYQLRRHLGSTPGLE